MKEVKEKEKKIRNKKVSTLDRKEEKKKERGKTDKRKKERKKERKKGVIALNEQTRKGH